MNELVYGQKVKVRGDGVTYVDTYLCLIPGTKVAVLLGAEDAGPYIVPLDTIEWAPSIEHLVNLIVGELDEGMGTWVRHEVKRAATKVLREHLTDNDFRPEEVTGELRSGE